MSVQPCICGRNTDCPCPDKCLGYSPQRQAEEAVLRAAEEVVRLMKVGPARTLPGGLIQLREAVDALRQPQAKRPAEVEPGTMFTFAPPVIAESQGPYRLIDWNGERRWLDGRFNACPFSEGHRIIPIPEQD